MRPQPIRPSFTHSLKVRWATPNIRADVLADLEQSLQQWFYGRRDLREKLLQSSDRWLSALAYESDRLVVLQQYLLEWERSVERKLRQLRAEE